MNRYFFPYEGRPGFPARSYAKLDQIEPPNLDSADDIIFAFDAIDADWKGFEGAGLLSLQRDGDDDVALKAFWDRRFKGPGTTDRDVDDLFDDLPMYRFEFVLLRNDPWAEKLIFFGETWLEIELDDGAGLDVDVFGGLFMPPVRAHLARQPTPAPASATLNLLFDMDNWPNATQAEIDAVLHERCNIQQLVMFDIGQGSANALVCEHGFVIYYFDVGCGAYRNAQTKPATVTFCTHESPPILLSHWDADHWAAAVLDKRLLSMTWLAPRQSVTSAHTTFGNDILRAGGRLLIIPASKPRTRWKNAGQSLELQRCTGNDRNGTGHALIVEDPPTDRGWLLTGDAAYDFIPGPLPTDLAAVIVPHHGANMGPTSIAPVRSTHPYSRLLYSFGPGNGHGPKNTVHPTPAAVAAHTTAGWPHGGWSPPPGFALAGLPVLATASNKTTHLNGAIVGWTAAPVLSGHIATCSDVLPITQS